MPRQRPKQDGKRQSGPRELCLAPPSFYSNHHIGGFDDRVGLGAFFESELLDRFIGDRRDYGFAAFEFDFDMRGRRTLVNFLDLAFEEIARGYFHIIFSY